MKRFSQTISTYLIRAIVPYFVFSWLLLSVILFVQQAGRFSDIFFSVNIPSNLVWQLALALIPNVIAFTCPMAVLVGVIIGLAKMQGDSELVAIRAAGVGNFQITLPVIILGVLLSVFAFYVNLKGVPFAARLVRQVAMQTAIHKLESPIEPGVFNTEVSGYTIYVKGGDIASGTWKNIFIYNEDEKSGQVRLITSNSGHIDTTGQLSELVLENASVSSFPKTGDGRKFVTESIGEVRFAIKTRRSELIEKLATAEGSPEELGLVELSEYAQSREGSERTEARILWQRRIVLSITPLIFCILGTSMMLRFSRGGRGFGIFLALLTLIGYYMLAFLGEQLARTDKISVVSGGLMPMVATAAVIIWFTYSKRLDFWSGFGDRIREFAARFRRDSTRPQTRNVFMDLTTGLRDFDLVFNLLRYFLLTLAFLAAVFVIFTAFELWKFAGTIDGGIVLLIKYLLYLLPFIYIQLAPSAAMVGTLATYVIKSRQNEIVTWTSAGQSVYRLLLPCFALMVLIGIFNIGVQELVLPHTNRTQDELRTQIRSRGVVTNRSGKFWVANDRRIYSFEPAVASDNERGILGGWAYASDNDKAVRNLSVYEFGEREAKLQTIYRAPEAVWERDRIRFIGEVVKVDLTGGVTNSQAQTGGELAETANPFLELRAKPSHLNISDTKAKVANSESELEKRTFEVALQKKYTTLLLPFVIALFTAPFALSLSRKGKVVTVGYAVALWLLFMGITNVFEQFGLNGFLAPTIAVWSPLMLFSMFGIYLLSKVKT